MWSLPPLSASGRSFCQPFVDRRSIGQLAAAGATVGGAWSSAVRRLHQHNSTLVRFTTHWSRNTPIGCAECVTSGRSI